MTGSQAGFSRLFWRGVLFRMAITAIPMGLAVLGAGIGRTLDGAWAPFLGACAGLVTGALLAREVKRRWDPLDQLPG